MKIKLLWSSAIFFTHLTASQSYAQNPDNHQDTVEVANTRDPELRSYSQILKGIKSYAEKHYLAPDSELYFILIPKNNGVNLRDVSMRLASDENSIPIPIDSTGRFQLPLIEVKSDSEYDIILNKRKGLFLVRPYIKTNKLPDDIKRLGDLRLECEVRWAIEKQDVSFAFSSYVKIFSSGNPCTSRFVNVRFYAPQSVNSIALDTPKSKYSIRINPFESYTLPLWDNEISDEALIKYTNSPATPSSEN